MKVYAVPLVSPDTVHEVVPVVQVLAVAVIVVLLSLVTGVWYFRKMERTFADVI